MEKPDFKKDGTKFNKKKQPPKLSKLKYNERIVQVKRVTKVVKGGKKNDFSRCCHHW
jgi:ribosomal protein S5